MAGAFAPTSVKAQGVVVLDRWYAEPLLYPKLGFMSYSQAGFGITTYGVGVGGLFHDLDGGLLTAQARAEGGFWSGGDGLGFEVKMGPMWTPRLKWWGAKIGIDPFYNQFNSTTFVLPATFGVEFPVDVILGPRGAHLIAGLTPAWVANPVRRVNWDTYDNLIEAGHESEWRLGFGLTLGRFSVTMVYSQRTTIMGSASGVGVGFSSAPYVPPESDDG